MSDTIFLATTYIATALHFCNYFKKTNAYVNEKYIVTASQYCEYIIAIHLNTRKICSVRSDAIHLLWTLSECKERRTQLTTQKEAFLKKPPLLTVVIFPGNRCRNYDHNKNRSRNHLVPPLTAFTTAFAPR